MKILIGLFFILLFNTSFIETKPKFFQGVTCFLHYAAKSEDRTIWVEVIQAESKIEAMRKFNTTIKSVGQFKGLEQTMYSVYEIYEEDIIK